MEAMPSSDPAQPIVAGIRRVVPASRWTFARIDPGGALVSFFWSHPNGQGQARLEDEFKRQRVRAPKRDVLGVRSPPESSPAAGARQGFGSARSRSNPRW